MLKRLKIRGITIAACAAMIALSAVMAACGGNDNSNDSGKVIVRNPQKHMTTPTPAPPPIIEVAQAPTPPESAQTTVPEQAEGAVPSDDSHAMPEVSYEVAEAAYKAREYAEAAELFTRYTERKPENPWGYYMLGLSAWKDGRNETAVAAFEQSIDLDPRHIKSHLNLSRVLLDMRHGKMAMERLNEALAIDPESSDAYRLRGRVFHQLNNFEAAILSYQTAIRLDTQDAWSMNNLALLLIETERYEEALPPLARAVQLRGDVAMFRNNLGMALEHTGRFRDAEHAYRSAVSIDESYARAVENLNRIEFVREDRDVTAVDFDHLANLFVEEVETWQVAGALNEAVSGRETDVAVSETPGDTPVDTPVDVPTED